MLDMNDRLTAYWKQIDEVFPEITTEELRQRGSVVQVRPPPTHRRSFVR